jgi:hypothetical protein
MTLLVLFNQPGAGGPINYALTCASGAYTYTGQAASLPVSHTLACDAGAYVYTGQDASFVLGHNLALDAGAYVYAGNDATLTYVPGATTINYTLACDAGAYVYTGVDAALSYVSTAMQAEGGGDGGTSKRKYYIRRRKQILIFDSVAQVDAYIEAEEEAAEAIAKAKSRGAKKRVIARVFKEQPEAVEITPLAELIESYKLPYNVSELIASENYQQIVDIQRIIQRIRDDEDEELLLLMS